MVNKRTNVPKQPVARIRRRNHRPWRSPAPDAGPEEAAAAGFPVVGIGASAGGLAAFEAFFSGMPADSRPGHGLRARAAPGPGPQAPHRAHAALHPHAGLRGRGRDAGPAQLRLHHPAQPRHGLPERRPAPAGAGRAPGPAPADRLLLPFPGPGPAGAGHLRRALRTGSDGTLGCGRSRARAAWSWPRSRVHRYDGMPRSALATGLVDFVLPPAEMPAQLIAYVAHAFGRSPGGCRPPAPAPRAP